MLEQGPRNRLGPIEGDVESPMRHLQRVVAAGLLAVAVVAVSVGSASALPPPGNDPSDPIERPTTTRPTSTTRDQPPTSAPASTTTTSPAPAGPATPSLQALVDGISVRRKSVTVVIEAPPGLAVTQPVEISASFNGTRLTRNYDPAIGTRLVHHFPEQDGQARTVFLHITLTERGSQGTFTHCLCYNDYRIEPLYRVDISPLTFTLEDDCDPVGASEALVKWDDPDGNNHEREFSMHRYDTVQIPEFARHWDELPASHHRLVPAVEWRELDPLDTGFYGGPYAGPELIPGTSRTVQARYVNDESDNDCTASWSYTIDHRLLTYPFL